MAREAQQKTIALVQADSTRGRQLLSAARPGDVEIQINRRAYELYSARSAWHGDEAGRLVTRGRRHYGQVRLRGGDGAHTFRLLHATDEEVHHSFISDRDGQIREVPYL